MFYLHHKHPLSFLRSSATPFLPISSLNTATGLNFICNLCEPTIFWSKSESQIRVSFLMFFVFLPTLDIFFARTKVFV